MLLNDPIHIRATGQDVVGCIADDGSAGARAQEDAAASADAGLKLADATREGDDLVAPGFDQGAERREVRVVAGRSADEDVLSAAALEDVALRSTDEDVKAAAAAELVFTCATD